MEMNKITNRGKSKLWLFLAITGICILAINGLLAGLFATNYSFYYWGILLGIVLLITGLSLWLNAKGSSKETAVQEPTTKQLFHSLLTGTVFGIVIVVIIMFLTIAVIAWAIH